MAIPASGGASSATGMISAEDPLTVRDVLVDKTAENAVVARDQAIVEARRLALQKLAEQSMSPEDFQRFQMPGDKDIALVVQDFEIKDEQLSATRYVARFTVRFTADVKNYIVMKRAMTWFGASLPAPSIENAAMLKAAPRSILVLPYFETVSGKTLLWEDPNDWRAAWQSSPPTVEGWTVVVPLGDISDLATGSSDAVWSGDYSVIEKLKANYNVDEVVLSVANRSGASFIIDLYVYKDGKLSQKKSVMPYVSLGAADQALFKQGVGEVMRFLQGSDQVPSDTAEAISHSLTREDPMPTVIISSETAGETAAPETMTSVDANMAFNNFTTWMELQKRLSALRPPVTVNIKSISKTSARFIMNFPGDMGMLLRKLSDSGISLSDAAAGAGSANPVQDRIYDVQMRN